MRKRNSDAQLLRELKSAQDVSAKKLRQKLLLVKSYMQ